MKSFKIIGIFVVLFIIQLSLAKDDSDESSEEMKVPPALFLKNYAITYCVILGTKYSIKSAKLTRDMLKDEALVANDKPEVMEFKKNLTTFLEKYDAVKKLEKVWDTVKIYDDTTEHYTELPEDKQTAESKFIIEIMDKYKVKELEKEYMEEYNAFLTNFKKAFENNKKDLQQSWLDWFEKLKTTTDYDEQIKEFEEFILM